MFDTWPALWDGLDHIRSVLEAVIMEQPELSGLAHARGDSPRRPPSSPQAVEVARRAVDKALGLICAQIEEQHPMQPTPRWLVRSYP